MTPPVISHDLLICRLRLLAGVEATLVMCFAGVAAIEVEADFLVEVFLAVTGFFVDDDLFLLSAIYIYYTPSISFCK